MKTRTITVTAVLVSALAIVGPAWPQAMPPPPGDRTVGLAAAPAPPADPKAQAFLYIQRKCPDLREAIDDLVREKYPDLWSFMETTLNELLKDKYADLNVVVQEEIALLVTQDYRDVSRAVVQLIDNKYPALKAGIARIIQESPPQDDPRPAITAYIREQYPNLLTDVLSIIKRRQPIILAAVQARLLERFPGLPTDVMTAVTGKYPTFVDDVLALAKQKRPELIPNLVRILNGLPPVEAQPEDPPTPE